MKEPFELDRYVLLRELGRGAIGVVYVAYHEGLDRKLAIKVLNKARAGRADLEARLRREARALAKLSHPNVVQVYDVGESKGRVYIVMEFVEGETLGAWMKQPHAIEEILEMFAAAGRGLAAAHAAGVVHRDFKPENVIVGVDGRPRVLDFGLARPILRDPDAPLGAIRSGLGSGSISGAGSGAGSGPLRSGPGSGSGPSKASLEPSFVAPADRTGAGEGRVGHEALETRVEADSGETVDGRGAEAGVDVGLTRTGARIGTPAYMSPEQFVAKPADAASDQFSFCVALHEAVYGGRPFTGKTSRDLMFQVVGGKVVSAPPHSRVPEWLRAVILRGLRPQPAERWPSMEALIAALEQGPQARSRRGVWFGLGAAALLAVGVSIGVLAARERETAQCATVEVNREALWSEASARELERAFARSGAGYAAATWAGVEDRMQRWVQTWAEERAAACEAGRAGGRGDRSGEGEGVDAEILDRRQACLARDRRAFEALVAQFGEADRELVEGAVEAVAALPDPRLCVLQAAAAAAGEGLSPPPRAVAAQVEELRSRLAELDTRLATGRWESALPLARAALAQAQATDYGPVIAEVQLSLGRLQAQSAQRAAADEAVATLQDALDEADRSGHLELIPRVATELAVLSVYAKPDPIRGRLWARRAQTSLDRLAARPSGFDDELGRVRARSIGALGNLERVDGELEQAELHLREALALLHSHSQGDVEAGAHPQRGILLNDLGNVLAARGEVEAARETYERALRETLDSFGEGHPRVGNIHYSLARLAMGGGDLKRAREQADLAFVTFAEARGFEHRDVGAVELLRAAIELGEGDVAGARDRADKARAIYEQVLAPDNVDRAEPHQMLGNAAFAAGELDDAITSYRAALAIKQAALPPGHIELVVTRANLGLVYMTQAEGALGQDPPDREGAREAFAAAVVELSAAEAHLAASEEADAEQLRDMRMFLGDALRGRDEPGDAARAAEVYALAAASCADPAPACVELELQATRAWAAAGEEDRARAAVERGRAQLGLLRVAASADETAALDELAARLEGLSGTLQR